MQSALIKEIFGDFFFGPEELEQIADKIGIVAPLSRGLPIPPIPFPLDYLQSVAETHLLVLFIPYKPEGEKISLVSMRSFFGYDPAVAEPCFYNQDWYLKEAFANENNIPLEWKLIRSTVKNDTRGKRPEELLVTGDALFPEALALAYTFFAAYHLRSMTLWENDFVWCRETDSNGDRIYVGRYNDPAGIAKNGFSIHRHLRISDMYGSL